MLIAEDLLLLVTDDDTGRLSVAGEQVDVGLAGANLIELTAMNRVDLSRETDQGKQGRILVRDPSPTGDPVLDHALELLTERQGKKPAAVLRPMAKHLRQTLYERLARDGVVRAQEGRVFGIFPSHRWPAQDARHEDEVRRLLTLALVQQTTPDVCTGALVALLHALKCEHKVVEPQQHALTKRELRARAKQIAKGNWGSEAVRTAIDQMTAAVVAATTAAVVATSSGAGD